MRPILLLLMIFFIAIACCLIFLPDQGYVLIRIDHYDIETTVIGMLMLLIIFFILLGLTTGLLKWIFNLPQRFTRKARKQKNAALIKFLEGDYQKVEKELTDKIAYAENPILNYLFAAIAAAKNGSHTRSDQYLSQASQYIEKKSTGKKQAEQNRLTLNITRVRLQLSRGETELAQKGLYPLLEKYPKHPEVLRLAEKIFLQTQSYAALLKILPAMRKIHLYPENEIQILEQKLYRKLPVTMPSRSKNRI